MRKREKKRDGREEKNKKSKIERERKEARERKLEKTYHSFFIATSSKRSLGMITSS